MVALLDEFPGVRMTFNLVPSLLVQLEAFAEDRAHDRYLELGLKPADALTRGRCRCSSSRTSSTRIGPRMIDVLSALCRAAGEARAQSVAPPICIAAPRRFTVDDLRDLQVWQQAGLARSVLSGRRRRASAPCSPSGATSAKRTSIDAARSRARAAERGDPGLSGRAATGQIEISTSPFYHPILPLLCDTDIYKRTHPDSRDAAAALHAARGRARATDARGRCHRAAVRAPRRSGSGRRKGRCRTTCCRWSRGAGFQWMATDELILARTLGITFGRDAAGQVDQPERLYAPYVVRRRRRASLVRVPRPCAVRSHRIHLRRLAAGRAADDFVARLEEAGRRRPARSGGEEPTIFVILDGENAWEHFEGGGRPFLRALYRRLAAHPGAADGDDERGVPAGAAPSSTGIFPGSWIDANFYIWIGHADDRRAWSQLAEARARGSTKPPAMRSRRRWRGPAKRCSIAEGSDWFWWYGDDHSSEHDLEFDDLFRRHLRNVYRLLERPIPDELFVSNISAGASIAVLQIEPTGLIAPVIDGEESSYFEWLGAGVLEVRDVAGAMHQTDRQAMALTEVPVRLQPRVPVHPPGWPRAAGPLLADGVSFWLTFIEPAGLRLFVRGISGRRLAGGWERREGPRLTVERAAAVKVAAGTILEIGLPFADLGLAPGAAISFFVGVVNRSEAETRAPPGATGRLS